VIDVGHPIPIQNLYYLFCYAWDQFPDGKAIETGLTESPRIVDLFAHILIRGTRRLLRRGLDQGYLEFDDDLRTVRGRIDLNGTVRRNLLIKNQINCRFDELDKNVLHNQILKTSIADLANADDIDRKLAIELRELYDRLGNISRIRLTSQCFHRVQVSRNRGQYGLLLKVCELLHHLRLPTESGTVSRFENIIDNEVRMSKVFQSFVRNFYRHEQNAFSMVGAETIKWDLEPAEPEFQKYLPNMITDVTLRSSRKTIVLDTKYYKQTLSNYRGERVYSSHLYQLFSYLSNLECLSEVDRSAEGILLYPVVGQHLDLKFEGRGHVLRVVTVNLDQDWKEIRRELLSIIGVQDYRSIEMASEAAVGTLTQKVSMNSGTTSAS
jgi:5-methylcytosine-specific restriction enzyme subunit McrC